MSINRLITLGCSVTEQPGWAAYTSQCTGLPLVNMAASSGSNDVQQHYVQHAMLTNAVSDTDLVIWQVTSTTRKYAQLPVTDANMAHAYAASAGSQYPAYRITPFTNIFDDTSRIELLSHADLSTVPTRLLPEADRISSMLFHMIALKQRVNNLIVLLGWEHAITPAYKARFEHMLKIHNIAYIDVPIVDWCIAQQLQFNGDNIHPTNRASSIYAQRVIFPILEPILCTTIKHLQLPIA